MVKLAGNVLASNGVKRRVRAAEFARKPVRLMSSMRKAVTDQTNPPNPIDVPLLTQSVVLQTQSDKIVMLHKSLEARLLLCTAAMEESAKAKAEVLRLTKAFQQNQIDHTKEMVEVQKKSFLDGQAAVVGEMKTLMSSNEFAAEMMWGKTFFHTENYTSALVSSCRWQRSNAQAVRCPQEAHELHLCEAGYFKKEGLEEAPFFGHKNRLPVSPVLKNHFQVR